MADLNYVKVVGRLGLTVADSSDDSDDNPDTVWCNTGEVWFTPLIPVTKNESAIPSPVTLGISTIAAQINPNGYLSLNGKEYVKLVDLTSEFLNPHIGPDYATYQVEFKRVGFNKTWINFDSFPARISLDNVNDQGVIDLTLITPVSVGGEVAVVTGPEGPPGSSTVTPDPDHDGFFVVNN